jgi:hypothetical protein
MTYSFHHARNYNEPDNDPRDPVIGAFFNVFMYDFELSISIRLRLPGLGADAKLRRLRPPRDETKTRLRITSVCAWHAVRC